MHFWMTPTGLRETIPMLSLESRQHKRAVTALHRFDNVLMKNMETKYDTHINTCL